MALGLSANAHNGYVDSKTLSAFYEHFFATGVKSDDMRKFFSENVTLMVVRRVQSNPTTFYVQVVGAITFSRPRDQVPTYLAYMAVSDGLHKFPSLSDDGKVQIREQGG